MLVISIHLHPIIYVFCRGFWNQSTSDRGAHCILLRCPLHSGQDVLTELQCYQYCMLQYPCFFVVLIQAILAKMFLTDVTCMWQMWLFIFERISVSFKVNLLNWHQNDAAGHAASVCEWSMLPIWCCWGWWEVLCIAEMHHLYQPTIGPYSKNRTSPSGKKKFLPIFTVDNFL